MPSCVNPIIQIQVDTERATEQLRALGIQLQRLRSNWLAIVGGEWPDFFMLLNRYARTGIEPEYFSNERWESNN